MASELIVAIVAVVFGVLFLLAPRLGQRKCERGGRPSHAVTLWRHLLLLVTIATIVIAAVLESKGLALGFAVPLGIAGALLGVVLLVAGATAKAVFGWRGLIRTPKYVPVVLRTLWRIRERADFAAARRASEKAGRIVREDGLVLWTDLETDIESNLIDAIQRCAAEFARLTGLSDARALTLRAIIFEHEATFTRYTKTGALFAARHMGNYSGGPGPANDGML